MRQKTLTMLACLLVGTSGTSPTVRAQTSQPSQTLSPTKVPAPVNRAVSVPYDRDLYPTWRDEDGDCQDARQEVLIAESLQPPQMDDRECRVMSGRWVDPYTDQTFTDPGDLEIDHMVPLAEAHRSGGDQWSAERRLTYANDLFYVDTLIAVSASANRSKGDKDPAQWLPSNQSYHCEYVRKWVVIKATWNLKIDAAEALTITDLLRGCP